MVRNYTLPDAATPVVHRVIGRSYVARCEDPQLSIKCMFGGVGRYVDDSRNIHDVDDTCFLILNSGNSHTVAKRTQTPMETFCIFLPDAMTARIASDLTRKAEDCLAIPQLDDLPAFNLIEHRHPYAGDAAQRIAAIRSAVVADRLTEDWLEEALFDLGASLVSAQSAVRARISRLPWARASTRTELYRRIHIARDYMHAHLAEPFSLTRAASAAALSPYHFLRAFRAILGVTPRAYVIGERIVRARGLLARTSCSVDEIAAMIGYESLPSFITLFRSRTGLTPTQYRRERGELSNRR